MDWVRLSQAQQLGVVHGIMYDPMPIRMSLAELLQDVRQGRLHEHAAHQSPGSTPHQTAAIVTQKSEECSCEKKKVLFWNFWPLDWWLLVSGEFGMTTLDSYYAECQQMQAQT